jgi:predicted nucleic acid-binding protein
MAPDGVLATSRFLVDTNVISALIGKKSPEPGIRHFFETVDEERMYLSVITVGEILKGIDLIPWPKGGDGFAERQRIQAQWEQRLEAFCARFADRIIDIDLAVARQWGRFHAERQREGRTISVTDTLIASCAHHEGLVIATIDGDFLSFADTLTMYNPQTHTLSGREQIGPIR